MSNATVEMFRGQGGASTLSGRTGLSTELHESAGRRLAWVALVYVIISLVIYARDLIDELIGASVEPMGALFDVRSLVAIAGALAVFRIGRTGRPPRGLTLPDVAVAFQVFAVLVPTEWDLAAQAERDLREMGRALGISDAEFVTRFIEPLVAHGIRLGASARPTWLGVWILIFPLIFPMTFRRALLSSVLTALAGLAPGLVGAWMVNDAEWLAPWRPGATLDLVLPTSVCVILALVTSRVIYRASVDLARERRMGSYQLTEKIGEGGMGEVWRARHRFLARPAAIKLIRPQSFGSESAEGALRVRFEREAQATASLTSPHSVELYDFGATEDGTFYCVMELLEGLDLRTLVEKHGAVPAERAVFLLVQACHSLGEAHDTGLIHRDVKPANLFACRRGPDHDWLKILDFGLVKPVRASGSDAAQLTAAGVATGTPAFMPPEMAQGERNLDGRADLYALGCVAYWLITGRLVFEAENAMQMVIRHARDTPEPASRVTELTVPASLDEIILDCLAKEPAARPPSAWVLRDRLRALEDELPAWSSARAKRWWDSHAPIEPTRRG